MTEEADFRRQVLELAKRYRWKVYAPQPKHKPANQSGTRGWPDLTLSRNGRLVFLELKRQIGGIVSAEQAEWIVALAQVPGVTARIVRPSDLGWVVEELRRGDTA